MKAITVAILGRPNVGKSTLFNRIIRQRQSIVSPEEGVTRDRLYRFVEHYGTVFRFIDTAGIDTTLDDEFNESLISQALIALEEADILIHVTDVLTGQTESDKYLSRIIHRSKKHTLLVVNKVDNTRRNADVVDFYSLGYKKIAAVSAINGEGVSDMLDSLAETMEPREIEPQDDDTIRVAIVGRPNAGKSTLINTLYGSDRCVVSEIAGTTRDAIDIDIKTPTATMTFIDTAGIKRKNAEKIAVEKFARIRAFGAVSRSHVCVVMIDVEEGVTAQDKALINDVEKAGRGVIIALNKWDTQHETRMEHVVRKIREKSPFLIHYPILCLSAKKGRNVDTLLTTIEEVHVELMKRIPTGPLNQCIQDLQQKTPPPMIQGKRLRVYYITQVSVNPPQFTLFINYRDRLASHYERYLRNGFRKVYKFLGVPIVFHIREKKSRALQREEE